MAPAAIVPPAVHPSMSPVQHTSPVPPPTTPRQFDDIFAAKFMHIIDSFKNDPSRGPLTQKDRKSFIETAFIETDDIFFGRRQLTDQEIKLRALTKVFYKVLAEEPWSEDWIRAPDVERKLSKFELHKDSIALAAEHNIITPRDAVRAAREAAVGQQETLKSPSAPKHFRVNRGPYDDIEIIYIAGTVSSTATNRIDRENIYPVAVSSVANVLQNHICRDMVRPYSMAERFINCTDTKELEDMRQFACNVCDFAPHLLDNDNVSLLVVLLILSRSDCCRRFENNGIRIEGSTISHRKAECMKNKMGWKTSEEKKPYDSFASEFQTRVKNACFPAPRAQRMNGRKPSRKSSATTVANQPNTYMVYPQHGAPPQMYQLPQLGYMAPPQVRPGEVNTSINIPAPAIQSIYSHQQHGSAYTHIQPNPGPAQHAQPMLPIPQQPLQQQQQHQPMQPQQPQYQPPPQPPLGRQPSESITEPMDLS